MSKTNVSKRNEVAKFLRIAELEATDERSQKECMDEMTDPNIIGLSQEDAKIITKAIRSDMTRRILADDFSDEDDIDAEDDESEPKDEVVKEDIESPGSDDEEDVEDEVEFEKDENPFEKSDEDLTTGEDLDFPAEEDVEDEEIIDEEGSPESEEIIPSPFGEEVEENSFEDESPIGDAASFGEGAIIDSPIAEGFSMEDGLGEEMGEVIPLDPNGSVTLQLPDGTNMELKLTKAVMAAIKHQKEVEAMNPSGQISMDELKQRKAQRQALRQILASQEVEDIAPDDTKKLGDDTSHGGKSFQMEDATHGVANIGNTETHATMKMTNSEGNSLLTDPGFVPNNIYTRLPADLMMNANAKDLQQFTNQKDGLFTKTIEGSDTPDPIPTTGMGADFWGWDKGFQAFDVPTQLDTTTQRFPIVQQATNDWKHKVVTASMNRECMGCHESIGRVEPLECEDCGSLYALCEACVQDEHCPTCASRSAASNANNMRNAEVNWDAYCGTAKDRQEVCEDNRGDGDPNNDGGFHASDKMGRAPKKSDAREMNVDAGQFEKEASKKIENLSRQNQALQIQMARMAKAQEVAYEMVANGQLAPEEVAPQVEKWVADNMSVTAMENFRNLAAKMGRRDFQTRLSETSKNGMERTASPHKIRAASLPFNPNPSVQYGAGELTDALTEMMKSSLPSRDDFDERTGVRLR